MVDEVKLKLAREVQRVDRVEHKKVLKKEIKVQDKVSISGSTRLMFEILPSEDFSRITSTIRANLEKGREPESTEVDAGKVADALIAELVKAILTRRI